jgi:hypothetical protein
MLNNGVYDCPYLHTDDEYVGKDVSCPGFYRCYRSHYRCVHDHYLCDGIAHCPYKGLFETFFFSPENDVLNKD